MTENRGSINLVVRDNAENREATNLVQLVGELAHIKQELNELNTFMSFFDQIMHDADSASLEETKIVPAGLSASPEETKIVPAGLSASPEETKIVPAGLSASPEETKIVPAGLSASLAKRSIIVRHLTIGLYRMNLNIVSELIGHDSTWMGSFLCQLNKLNNARNTLVISYAHEKLRSLIANCVNNRCERSDIITRELANLLQ